MRPVLFDDQRRAVPEPWGVPGEEPPLRNQMPSGDFVFAQGNAGGASPADARPGFARDARFFPDISDTGVDFVLFSV